MNNLSGFIFPRLNKLFNKKKRFLRVMLVLILYIIYSCSTFFLNDNRMPNCTDWSLITLGEYEISNNVWGKGNINNYSQCIFTFPNQNDTSTKMTGWSWNWPKIYDGVKSYPSILYGYKPWNKYSTTKNLPKKISEVKNIIASYDLNMVDTGAVNLLLESWITKTEHPAPEDRVAELAIQLYQKKWPGQAGEYIESTIINGINFDFYIDESISNAVDEHHWIYYGFVHPGEPVLKANVDIMEFVNYLINKNYVDKSHYIATVELGNEIDYGNGKTEIKHFSVNVIE